jgi:L-alanine-DL-glutamate epimerase-like enolase superfamily enzyme
MLTFRVEKKVFDFTFGAGTSRGILHHKKSWFIHAMDSETLFQGIGECSVIEGLTPEYLSDDDYISRISQAINLIGDLNAADLKEQLFSNFSSSEIEEFFNHNSSIRFGFETAILDSLNAVNGIYFHSLFVTEGLKIPINGLIWMGNESFMYEQIEQKLIQGFTTLKMKVGAIDFNQELAILRSIRKNYNSKSITLRVDANGAFSPENVMERLKQLFEFEIHSIEQPIHTGNFELLKRICIDSPIPIALDEELIGVFSKQEKQSFLKAINPQFIVLKPSLHGGFKGTYEWIKAAESNGIQWWITSALESNVGLSAICQFTAQFFNQLPQGLGTGALYANNIDMGLIVENGFIFSAGH